MKVRIRKVRWESSTPAHSVPGEICLYLATDNWDDFGYQTMFHLVVVDAEGAHKLEEVKILFANAGDEDASSDTAVHIRNGSSALDRAHFASLGQSVDYYKWFSRYKYGLLLLEALADICVSTSARSRWEGYAAFNTSLVRFSDAKKAYEEAPDLLAGSRTSLANMTFTYKVRLQGAARPHVIEFNLDALSKPERRVVVLIGPNGVGKSTLLHHLAPDLSGAKLDRSRFPKPPFRRFSRQILVSTSPFDVTMRPGLGEVSSYRFVGLRWKFETLRKDVAAAKRKNKDWDAWLKSRFTKPDDLLQFLSAEVLAPPKDHLAALGSNRQNWESVLGGIIHPDDLARLTSSPEREFRKLSAGQQAIVTILSGLSAEMDDEALVLIDEPENHLHPRFLSLFFNALVELLRQRNGYAIVATHSELLLQGVTSDAVRVLGRDGSDPIVGKLVAQSFGAGLPSLSMDAFHVDALTAHWVKELQELLDQRYTVESILELFNPPLEPEPESFLRTLAEEEE